MNKIQESFKSLVEPENQRRLKGISAQMSKNNWQIGDIANYEINRFRKNKEINPVWYEGLYDWHVWVSLAEIVGLSSGRVQVIAAICRDFKPGSRIRWFYAKKHDLAFGYFENVRVLSKEYWTECFDFTLECQEKDMLGRLPKVSEFVALYQQHILAKNPLGKLIDHTPEQPIEQGAPGHRFSPFGRSTPLDALLGAKQAVFAHLSPYFNRPLVKRYVDLLEELDELTPQVIAEIGEEVVSHE